MKKFLIPGVFLALLAGCMEPEVPEEDTGPEIVPLSIELTE